VKSNLLLATVLLGCAAAPRAQNIPVRPSLLAIEARGTFLPPPLDGPRLLAKHVELQLPRGCAPLDIPSFVKVASMVDDEESEFLGGCNLLDDAGKPRVTIVLIRHRMSLETGDDAAASLRRAPGTIDVKTTTAGPTAGAALGPEVVLSENLPTGPKARPSASVYFGAHDGLYVLYTEVDGDRQSLDAWSDAMTSTLRPTPSARPIRWRAPTRIAPSAVTIGKHKLRLPEGIDLVPMTRRTFGMLVGDPHDPLDMRESEPIARFRDEGGIAASGMAYHARLLAPIAATPAQFAKVNADVRGVSNLESKMVAAKLFDVARVDGTRADGGHEVFGAFEATPGEVTVLRFAFSKAKWPAYAPFIDDMLASLEPELSNEPY
jgi:hypothetical protein